MAAQELFKIDQSNVNGCQSWVMDTWGFIIFSLFLYILNISMINFVVLFFEKEAEVALAHRKCRS